MTLDINNLLPQIDQVFDEIEQEYQAVPGWMLTEDDLKCVLYKKLTCMPELSEPVRTQDRRIHGTPVHAEVSWFGEDRRLCIKPDITIIEPENMSILHGYVPRTVTYGKRPQPQRQETVRHEAMPLPSKQFEFGGKAIIFELKFARRGMTNGMFRLMRIDFEKMMRLFEILDRRGEGDSIFGYMVIFNKYRQDLEELPFAEFLRQHGSGLRHKILYKTGRLPLRSQYGYNHFK
jgi:hypothetical protein